MQVEVKQPDEVEADVVVVPVAEDGETPPGADARVRDLISSGEAGTDFGDITVVHSLGTRADADAVRTAVAGAARETRRVGGTLAYVLNPALDLNASEQARAAADG